MRKVERHYQDPVEMIWIRTAGQLGINVQRDDEVFASWDGEATLRLGTPETLDADDCLAQMVFHELCHALVAGPESLSSPDWGLEADDFDQEHACLRLQAAIADRHGLRNFFAATTDFRAFYDQLPADPMTPKPDPSICLAKAAWVRWRQGPWFEPMEKALAATAEIQRLVSRFAEPDSLWSCET